MDTTYVKRQNEWRYCLSYALFNTALLMVNGTIMQSFMLESGIPEEQVSVYISVAQIVQVIAMMICSGYVDHIKNIIRAGGFLQIVCFPMFALLIILCMTTGLSVEIRYLCILIMGCIVSLMVGIYTVTCYKLPYHIMDMERYGSITAISGLFLGVCGMGLAALMSAALERGAYFSMMRFFFGMGGITVIVSAVIQLRMKNVKGTPEEQGKGENNKRRNLLCYWPFYVLIFPNFFRGFFLGILNLAVTIGYYYSILDGVTTGYMIVITNATTIVGCYLYSVFSKKCMYSDGKLIFLSSVVAAVCLPLMLVGNSGTIFLVIYGIVYFAYNFVTYATPVALVRIVDYEVMGQYSAWRMLLTNLGTAAAGFVCVAMLETLGGIATLVIAGVMQLISGAAYYLVEVKSFST